MSSKKNSYYPNIWQSFGILGIAILLTLALSPVNLLLSNVIDTEISFLVYYLLAFGGTFLLAHLIRKNRTGNNTYDLSMSSLKLMVLVSISVIAIQQGIIAPLINSLYIPDFMREIIIQLANQKGVFSFIAIVIAAPVLEEFIFRGIILDGLLKKYSPLKSILISSLLFGIAHLNPWQLISAFVLGVFSGWIYYRTKKLFLSILIHLVNNLVGFISLHFIDVEAMMSKSTIDLYGGLLNLILMISAAITVTIIGVYWSEKEIKRIESK